MRGLSLGAGGSGTDTERLIAHLEEEIDVRVQLLRCWVQEPEHRNPLHSLVGPQRRTLLLALVWLSCPVIDDPGGAARSSGRELTANSLAGEKKWTTTCGSKTHACRVPLAS